MAKRKSSARSIQWISLLTGIALGVAFTLGARQALDFFAGGLLSERADSITYENPEAQELSFRFFDMLSEGGAIDNATETNSQPGQATIETPAQTTQETSIDSTEIGDVSTPTSPETVEQPPAEATPSSPTNLQKGPRFLLQAGSFRDADKANALRAHILLLGLASRTVQVKDPEGGIFNRVIVGPYDTRDQAADAAKRLRAEDIDSLALYRAS